VARAGLKYELLDIDLRHSLSLPLQAARWLQHTFGAPPFSVLVKSLADMVHRLLTSRVSLLVCPFARAPSYAVSNMGNG
jgi:hypothetical protein